VRTGSKVLPRIFIDPLGVSGQLVPEAIEVDALSALHQTLLVRTPEIEVHSIGLRRCCPQSPIPVAVIDHHQRVIRSGY